MRHFLADTCQILALSSRRRGEAIINDAKRRAERCADVSDWWTDVRELLLVGGPWREIRERTATRKARDQKQAARPVNLRRA